MKTKSRVVNLNTTDFDLKILGLDCSSSTIGWGLIGFEQKPVLLSHGHIKPLKSDNNIFIRLNDVYNRIQDLCNDLSPTHIGIEDILLHMKGKSSANTITTLAIFNRLSGFSIFKHTGIIPKLIPVATIRKLIRSKHTKIDSKFKKEDIPDIIRNYLEPKFSNIINRNDNISAETYDEADGIAIAWAYTILMGKENE